jgi:4'-phosphopantetheinyl transferase
MGWSKTAMSMLADRAGLENGEVHVWNATLTEDGEGGEWAKILQPEERARAAAFAFDPDRRLYVHSHGVLRRILSRYTGREPGELVFEGSGGGKPRLKRRPDGGDLHFSLSHSGLSCLIAVRLRSPVGVDVERLRPLPDARRIARRWFTPAENDALARLSGAALERAFFALWTHREAVIKALGENLETGFSALTCALDSDASARLVSWRGDEAVTRPWRVRRLEPADGYLGAVAALEDFGAMRCLTWDASPPPKRPPTVER